MSAPPWRERTSAPLGRAPPCGSPSRTRRTTCRPRPVTALAMTIAPAGRTSLRPGKEIGTRIAGPQVPVRRSLPGSRPTLQPDETSSHGMEADAFARKGERRRQLAPCPPSRKTLRRRDAAADRPKMPFHGRATRKDRPIRPVGTRTTRPAARRSGGRSESHNRRPLAPGYFLANCDSKQPPGGLCAVRSGVAGSESHRGAFPADRPSRRRNGRKQVSRRQRLPLAKRRPGIVGRPTSPPSPPTDRAGRMRSLRPATDRRR